MRDDLVTEKIEIDPMRVAPALGTAEQAAVEPAGGVEIVNWKCEVEGRNVRHATLIRHSH
jgi:hypothetical protein